MRRARAGAEDRLAQSEQSLRNQPQSYAELDTALGGLVCEVEHPKP